MNTNIFFCNQNKPNIFNNDILNKHIFFYIAQQIINKETIQNININKGIIGMFICNNKYSIKAKYNLIKEAETNIFYNKTIVNNFINFLCKIQKVYFAFIKLKNIFIYKKSQTQVDYDICLNPINIAKATSLCIYQNNRLYWFLIRDLINIINTALTNAPGFFSEPLVSKNPYNNIPFNKSTLYNIYFAIKYSSIKTPELIHKYFITNFNLNAFTIENEYLIREHVIDNYIKNTPDISLHQALIIMITEYNKRVSPMYIIHVHDKFPKEKLVKILKPYLLLYFRYSYSLIEIVKMKALRELNTKLKIFTMFNPNFGRKISKINFDESYINFNIENNDDFLTSHNNIINNDDDDDNNNDINNMQMILEDEYDNNDEDDNDSTS